MSNFTAITGLNGSGKSNVLDAIIFCLNLENPKLLRIKKNEELINSNSTEAFVEITFKDVSIPDYSQIDKTLRITRILQKDGKSKCYLNNSLCTASTIRKLLSNVNITKNAQNMILQGNITKVLSINKNLKGLIQETAGIKNYEEEKLNALSVIEKKEVKLQNAKEVLIKRLAPFIEKLKDERQNYLEQKICEEKKEENIKLVNDVSEIIKNNEKYKLAMKITSDIEIFKKETEELNELKQEKSKDEESFANIFEMKKHRDEKTKQMEIIRKKIVELENLINNEDKENEKFKKQKIEGNNLEDLEREIKIWKEKENLLYNELRNRDLAEVGLKNENLKDKLEEIQKIKNKRNYVENEIRKLESFFNSHKDLKDFTRENNFNLLNKFIDENLEKTEKIEKLIVDKKEMGDLALKHDNLKRKLNYPLKEGIYGTVFENMRLKDEKYNEVIEIILGARKKFIIVENENVGTEIINQARQRINVIPLNKIKSNVNHSKNVAIKKLGGFCAIELIIFEEDLNSAMEYIFGNIYVFENKEKAKKACFSEKVMTISLDGNQYDPRGIVTGGKRRIFNDEIVTKKEIVDLAQKLNALESKNQEFKKYENNYYESIKIIESLKDYKNKKNEMEILENKIEMISRFMDNKKNLEKELKTVENKLNNLNCLLKEKTEIAKNEALDKIKHQNLENELQKMHKNCAEVKNEINLMNENIKTVEIKENKKTFEIKDKELTDEKINYLIVNLCKFKKMIRKNLSILSNIQKENFSIDDNFSEEFLDDLYETIRNIYINNEGDILTPEMEDDFNEILLTSKKELENLNNKTKIIMDPKNFEFLEKNEENIKQLEQKLSKLESDKIKLRNKMEILNQQSQKETEEAHSHLNKVTGKFLRYFIPESDVLIDENYDIKVKINTWKNNLSELSGGQRSIIALSLIFAMLTFKPAPFYLFDEIDSALDLSFTTHIGETIRNEFGNAQFIVVSLKEEFYKNAESLYQVFLAEGKTKVKKIK